MPPPRLPRDMPILVIDDSAAIRARMESYLQALGFSRVRLAASVEEGLEAFREQPAELVFLDLMIDEELGLDFATAALKEQPLTEIVILSALAPSHEQVTAAIAEGAREMLAKPVTFSALENALHRLAMDRQAHAGGGARRSVEDASYH